MWTVTDSQLAKIQKVFETLIWNFMSLFFMRYSILILGFRMFRRSKAKILEGRVESTQLRLREHQNKLALLGLNVGVHYLALSVTAMASPKPTARQITWPFWRPQLSSQTVPHWPSKYTSTLPSAGEFPSARRTEKMNNIMTLSNLYIWPYHF